MSSSKSNDNWSLNSCHLSFLGGPLKCYHICCKLDCEQSSFFPQILHASGNEEITHINGKNEEGLGRGRK